MGVVRNSKEGAERERERKWGTVGSVVKAKLASKVKRTLHTGKATRSRAMGAEDKEPPQATERERERENLSWLSL